MMNEPLSDAAKAAFKDALLVSAGRVLDHPDGFETVRRFLQGRVFLVLTADRLFVREVPQAGDDGTDEGPAGPHPADPADGAPTGMYL